MRIRVVVPDDAFALKLLVPNSTSRVPPPGSVPPPSEPYCGRGAEPRRLQRFYAGSRGLGRPLLGPV